MKSSKTRLSAVAALALLMPCHPAAAESVGLNFSVAGNEETELEVDAAAGAPEIEQSNWNNLEGPSGGLSSPKDNMGAEVKGMNIEWKVPAGDTAWRSKVGEHWGFTGNNLKLQKGYVQLGGSLSVSEIPYPKYDVYVYLNADLNGGKGSVTISSPAGGVDPKETYFYDLGWLDGKFITSSATTPESTPHSNCVVFTGNQAKEFALEWDGKLAGGWTGVSAVQIVAAP